jgi:hypothetical protein
MIDDVMHLVKHVQLGLEVVLLRLLLERVRRRQRDLEVGALHHIAADDLHRVRAHRELCLRRAGNVSV